MITTTRTLVALALLAVLAAPAPAAADPGLEPMLPADADIVVLLRDAPHAVAAWKGSPLASLLAEPELQSFVAPLRAKLDVDSWDEQVRAETGYTLTELSAMVEGDVVVYVPGFADALAQARAARGQKAAEAEEGASAVKADDPPFAIVALARVGDHAGPLEELLVRKEQEARDKGEKDSSATVVRDYREVTLHVEQDLSGKEPRDIDSWAITHGVLAFASEPEHLQSAIDAILDGGAAEPLSANPGWATVSSRTGASDMVAYLNLTDLMPLVQKAIVEDAGGGKGAPFTPQALVAALGLDALHGVFAAGRLAADGTELELGLLGASDHGILKLFAYGPGAAPRPTLVPADATGFSAARFDVKTAWAGLEEMLNAVNPALLAMVGAQLDAKLQEAGLQLDLRHDLLERFGNEMFVASQAPEATPTAAPETEPTAAAGQSVVLGLQITDRQGVELAVETLKGLISKGSEPFTTRDYLDTTIYSLKPEISGTATGASAHYALTDGWLLVGIGSPVALESVLVTRSRPKTSAWNRADVKAALALLPSGAAMIGYQDTAASLHGALKTFAAIAGATAGKGGEGAPVDAAAVPDEKVLARYLGPTVAGLYRDREGFYYRLRILPGTGAAR